MRYSGLDVLKFIAAFGIVGCHLGLANRSAGAEVLMRLTDVNVGIFAAISGFFLMMGLAKTLPLGEAVRKRALRLLPLYGVWSGVYLVVSVGLGRHFDRLTDVCYWESVLFRGGASCHLWYLIALFYFTVVILIINRLAPRLVSNVGVLLGASAGLLWVSTWGDYTFWWGYYFSRLAAFALLGMALYRLGASRKVEKRWWVLCALAVAGIGLRVSGCGGVAHKFILDYVCAALVLPAFVWWPWSWGDVERRLAEVSLGVYLVHPLIAFAVGMVAKRWISTPVGLGPMLLLWVVVWGMALGTTVVMKGIKGWLVGPISVSPLLRVTPEGKFVRSASQKHGGAE